MNKLKIAVFPGTFCPFTIGHQDILERALEMFDQVIVYFAKRKDKNVSGMRQELCWRNTFDRYKGTQGVRVMTGDKMTVDFCKEHNAKFIIRGIRNAEDFLYEQHLADINKTLDPNIETVFITAKPELRHISSSLFRSISKLDQKQANKLLPKM